MKSAGGQLWVLVAQLGSVLSMLCMGKKSFLGNVSNLLAWIIAGSVLELVLWLFYLRV